MNYWYAPVDESSGKITPRLPPELIAAVAAPWRSTSELEAVQRKAISKAHYDLAGAAQSVLSSRKQQEAQDALLALVQSQAFHKQHQEAAEAEAVAAVDSIWALHVEQLRQEASAAIRALQDQHEDALTKLRLDQVAKAHDTGIRTQRCIKELRDLRRSEAVLVKDKNYWGAFQVRAHADVLAAEESRGAYADWLLKCHNEQERLLAKQQREVEALSKRLGERLRDLEMARDRDLEKLGRKIKVANVQQGREFSRERHNFEAAMRGHFLNTRTTRSGRSLADAFPTLAWVAESSQKEGSTQAAGTPAGTPRSTGASGSRPGSTYLGARSSDEVPIRRRQGDAAAAAAAQAQGVRFAPTPPREAWAIASESGGSIQHSGSAKGDSVSTSGASTSTTSTSTSTSQSPSSGISGKGSRGRNEGEAPPHEDEAGGGGGGARPPSRPTSTASARQGDAWVAARGQAEPGAGAHAVPSSAAVGSGTSGAAMGSGSSALTEEALRAMNQAMGAPRAGCSRSAQSLQSSSFKSNQPYAGGMSAWQGARRMSPAPSPEGR